jgi:SAM-dependent methyltransferase
MKREKNIKQFSRDVLQHSGYIYTSNGRLSSQMANDRLTKMVKDILGSAKGKTIIDVGCGDGTYTYDLLQLKPKSIMGIDPSKEAIKHARARKKIPKNLKYKVHSIYQLKKLKKVYDIAIVRGVLHHLYDAPQAIKQVSSIAHTILIIEPNGYNPILKIIERISPYHKAHEEKSYAPHTLDGWFHADKNISVQKRIYCGLVPFFCPDIIAKVLKRIEPYVEATPFLRNIACAVYVQKIISKAK